MHFSEQRHHADLADRPHALAGIARVADSGVVVVTI